MGAVIKKRLAFSSMCLNMGNKLYNAKICNELVEDNGKFWSVCMSIKRKIWQQTAHLLLE
jgi:hypothetical protein